MAEGLLEGALGGEEEKPEVEAPETLAGVEAFAAAIAAKLAGNDPEVARDTSTFLKKQAQLLEIQAAHLKDEHAARLHFLRGQAREVDIRRFGLRLRVGFQLFMVLIASVFGIGCAMLIRDAVNSRQVVVDPIDVSANVASRVPDGKIIASSLLDELSRLCDSTRTSSAARSLTGAWAGNINLEVPESGVSLGELSRLLKERFGHDVHIDGDVIESPTGGVAFTIRGTDVPPKTFSGDFTDLQRLSVSAAEYVYSKSQPARWAAYLLESRRLKEATSFCRTAFASSEKGDRPYLLTAWGHSIAMAGGSPREALRLYREALKLKPDFWIAQSNVQIALVALGDEEGAWRAGEEMRAIAGGRPGKAREIDYEVWDYLTWNLQPTLDATIADANENAGIGTQTSAAGPYIADIQARLHDAS